MGPQLGNGDIDRDPARFAQPRRLTLDGARQSVLLEP